MDRETYRKQKAFAGEKKASMLRRCVGHDYTTRQMYLITMVTEGRRPLLGTLAGDCNAARGSKDAPHVVLTELGRMVEREWLDSERHHPEIRMVALQVMPDHVHGIVFVRERMEQPLGMVLRGFKQKCNRWFVALTTQQTGQAVQQTGLATQQTQPVPPVEQAERRRDRRGEDREHGLLFARGYNDRLLRREGQLQRWIEYLQDNPRRLMMKRQHPELFRVQFGWKIGNQTYAALGNRFLLDCPDKRQVRCSRRLTDEEIATCVQGALAAAEGGAVHVSPAISKGEKAVMRALLNAGRPLVFLEENGLTPYTKPGGEFFEACARGQLLILAPWEHHNERIAITREQCLALNELAREVCAL